MFRLLLATMVASTGLIVSSVEAGDYGSEGYEMTGSNQLESLSTTGSTTGFNGTSSPAMYMPPRPTPNLIINPPQPPQSMKICWMVLEDQVCSGDS